MKLKGRMYISLLVFAICFALLSVAYVPNITRVEYVSPCDDTTQVDKLLPLTCGKAVFTYSNGKIVATVSDIKIDVAVVTGGTVTPVNQELYDLLHYCCTQKHEPIRVIDASSLARAILVSLLISTTMALATYVLLRKKRD